MTHTSCNQYDYIVRRPCRALHTSRSHTLLRPHTSTRRSTQNTRRKSIIRNEPLESTLQMAQLGASTAPIPVSPQESKRQTCLESKSTSCYFIKPRYLHRSRTRWASLSGVDDLRLQRRAGSDLVSDLDTGEPS
jgi:hypothetical protein